ncbi:O-antigen ligase family protein [Bacillus sp. Marseille-Q3570]|uniref:O-antigen ligase family protein n=1 Tax=Bacillus sp. Marseille-Q3570 TaxID=2963522 RepID=UPI0021B7410F|nr:O-antigen ligase family protein [Bacillus sp. Marseille-Q3570]
MRNLDAAYTRVNQIILAILFSFILGWTFQHVYMLNSWNDLVWPGMLVVSSLAILHVVKKIFQYQVSFTSLVLYLLIASFFIGPGIINVTAGPISIFPYRIFLMVMGILFLFEFVRPKHKLTTDSIYVKPALYFFVYWVGYGLLSLSWVKSLSYGARDFIFLTSGILTILFVVFFFYRERDYVVFFSIWIGAVLLFILLGFWNHLTHQHLPISRLATAPDYIRGRPSAVFTNENDFASFMVIGIFFGFALFNHVKKLWLKGLGLFITLAGLYLILVSTSRASIIAILLGFSVWFIFLANLKQKVRTVFLGLGAVFLGTVLFFERVKVAVGNVITEVSSVVGDPGVEEGSVDIRKNLLRNGMAFLQDTYGIGIGAGNAEYYIKNESIYPTFGQTNLHNWWAEIMVNYGVFIFTCYLLLYIGMVIKLFRINRTYASWKVKMISESLILGLVVFSIASVSPSSIMTLSYTWLLFAFGLGFLNYMHLNIKIREGAFEDYASYH